ncbi:MAG: PDDEXK nuclease domain-containing protein [Candidatus Nanopelagicales bacterium]
MSKDEIDYAGFLGGLRDEIVAAQGRAARAINTELLLLYWRIGTLVAEAQSAAGWGTGLIPRLSRDLRSQLPDIKGFSERNLGYMVRFAREYGPVPTRSPEEVLQLAIAKTPDSSDQPILQVAVAKTESVHSTNMEILLSLPWALNLSLLDRIPDLQTRFWYAKKAKDEGWSRERLNGAIRSGIIDRTGTKADNFQLTLAPSEAEKVRASLKDPYLFDFLTLDTDFREQELEAGLISQLKDFLLELGVGFAFVGRQYRLELEGNEYFLDLLFYHLKLRCYVVIELKRGSFLPEYAGKLNFYLNLVDDQLRHADDKPSIGLILCQEKSRIVAEYALRGLDKAIGVSEYQLTQSLPKSLVSSLPRIEDIEAELSGAGDEGQ